MTINDTDKDNPNETKEIKKEDEVSDWLKNLPGKGTAKKGADNPGEGKGDGEKTGVGVGVGVSVGVGTGVGVGVGVGLGTNDSNREETRPTNSTSPLFRTNSSKVVCSP